MSKRDIEFDHALRNQVAIVVSYCDLLLGQVPPDSPMRRDLLELQKAARTAMDMLREPDRATQ